MKKYNLLAFILLASLFIACEDKEKDTSGWFVLSTTDNKAQFTADETATLSITNTKNKTVAS